MRQVDAVAFPVLKQLKLSLIDVGSKGYTLSLAGESDCEDAARELDRLIGLHFTQDLKRVDQNI